MAIIIPLKSYSEYSKALDSITEEIADMKEAVYGYAIDLATKGKWKEWSDKQAIGTEFSFSEDMLCDTGDKNVDSLMKLFYEMHTIYEVLTEKRQLPYSIKNL